MAQYLYLFLMIFSVAFPLGASWDRRFAYFEKWPSVLLSTGIVAVIFLIWDVFFTAIGIWGFNPDYLIGLDIINLPVEEWSFFVLIPFACLFIYECTNYFFKSRPLKGKMRRTTYVVAATLLILGFFNLDKWYTGVTFISTALFLLAFLRWNRRDFLDRMWLGYLFSLIPFVVVNGILTGSFLESPIVWYNNEENLGIRFITIPIEDSIYLMLLLFSIIWIYETRLKRFPVIN